jgi:integrase
LGNRPGTRELAVYLPYRWRESRIGQPTQTRRRVFTGVDRSASMSSTSMRRVSTRSRPDLRSLDSSPTSRTSTESRSTIFHDLRRTGVRNLRKAGVSESVVMKISGHKTASIFKRYDITDREDAARRSDVPKSIKPP